MTQENPLRERETVSQSSMSSIVSSALRLCKLDARLTWSQSVCNLSHGSCRIRCVSSASVGSIVVARCKRRRNGCDFCIYRARARSLERRNCPLCACCPLRRLRGTGNSKSAAAHSHLCLLCANTTTAADTRKYLSVRSSVCLLTNDTSAQLLRPRHCAATGMQMRPRDRLRARGNYRGAPTEIRIGISVDTGFSIGRRARSTKSDDESGALFLVCP